MDLVASALGLVGKTILKQRIKNKVNCLIKFVFILLFGNLSLLHTSDVSTSARTFALEHKRRKQGGSYLALTFCRFTLENF